MIQVKSLVALKSSPDSKQIWSGIEKVFFDSSVKKEFKSNEEKAAFRYKYLGWYAEHRADHFFIALDNTQTVQGYICGSPTTSGIRELLQLHPWFQAFESLFSTFPAHLHINCADTARGQGLGSTLLAVFENTLKAQKVPGVHLVTAPDARNVGFYDKNGYKFTQTSDWQKSSLLFMGKHLELNL